MPVLSQAKTVFQVVCGDVDGGLETQEDFFIECPGIAHIHYNLYVSKKLLKPQSFINFQATAAVQYITGDEKGAAKTLVKSTKSVSNFVDSIPLVGHAKAVIHYGCGDKKGGDQALYSANRSATVAVGGVAGFAVGGPVGAFAGESAVVIKTNLSGWYGSCDLYSRCVHAYHFSHFNLLKRSVKLQI